MGNSGVVQEMLNKYIEEFATKELLLPKALRRAAAGIGLDIQDSELQLLVAAILGAKQNQIALDVEPPCAFGATQEEMQATIQALIDGLPEAIAAEVGAISEAVSEALPEALANVADLIGARLSEQSLEHAAELAKQQARRIATVQRLWGPSLERLDILRHLVVEWSHAAIEHGVGAYSKPHTAVALGKLATRIHEVVGEIVTLAREAYADGALARWRSLHELCVVAMFLAKRSDECAEMYLSHHAVEELRLLNMDKASGTSGVANSHRDRYVRQLCLSVANLAERFGAAFTSDYGWAAVELGTAKTNFRRLEECVGLEKLRAAYKQANSVVHGGALATLSRVSLGVGVVDGASAPPEYGCEVAANYAASSLAMLVAELCLDTESADLVTFNIVIQRCATEVRDRIEVAQERVSPQSLRARLLRRKAAQREARARPRRNARP